MYFSGSQKNGEAFFFGAHQYLIFIRFICLGARRAAGSNHGGVAALMPVAAQVEARPDGKRVVIAIGLLQMVYAGLHVAVVFAVRPVRSDAGL